MANDRRLIDLITEDPYAENGVLEFFGVTNPFEAMLVKDAGYFPYFSGAGISNFIGGHLDDGTLRAEDVLKVAKNAMKHIKSVPNIADADTGFGSIESIEKCVIDYYVAGIEALHIEDQPYDKKVCGHVEGKHVCSIEEMEERLEAALRAKDSYDYNHIIDIAIIARVDAFNAINVGKGKEYGSSQYDEAVKRALVYQKIGVDAIFIEAVPTKKALKQFRKDVPDIALLFNATEGYKSPKLTLKQLQKLGVKMVIHPVTLQRAASQAYFNTLEHYKRHGNTERMERSRIASREIVSEIIKKYNKK